jgi:hypothetical protein
VMERDRPRCLTEAQIGGRIGLVLYHYISVSHARQREWAPAMAYNIDDATRSCGKASAVKTTAANSYIRAFHVDSEWHKYKA